MVVSKILCYSDNQKAYTEKKLPSDSTVVEDVGRIHVPFDYQLGRNPFKVQEGGQHSYGIPLYENVD